MKRTLLFPVFIFLFTGVRSQSNINFETGHFQNWTGAYNNTNCGTSTPNPMTAVGIDTLNSPPQHAIVSNGFDPSVTLALLAVNSPFGGNYAVRLGDTIDGCRASRLKYAINVTPQNLDFSFSYALVFNDNGTHAFKDAPKFVYRVTDANSICLTYTLNPSSCDTIVYSSTDTSFHHGSNNPNGIYYTMWRQLCFNLTPYIGQSIRVEFTSSDCDAGSHRGYAYVDCQIGGCSGSTAINKFSDLSTSVSVYPNPANNLVNLTFKILQSDAFEITLCDIQGNILMKDNFASAPGQITKTYKTEDLPQGIYFISLRSKRQETIQKKLIITNH